MKIFPAIIALSLLSSTLSGQGTCTSCTVYKGYIAGDMGLWKKGMDEARVTWMKDASSCNLYSLTEAGYGYAGYLLERGNKAGAKPYVDDFEKNVNLLAAFPEYKTETDAFRVALLGFRMGLNPAKAMTLGPKALKQLEKAMGTGDNNPYTWIEKANSEAHMPAFVGGSKIKAAKSFLRAIELFELKSESLACNWRYLNTFLLLAKVLEQTGDYKGARDIYLKALKAEPAFKRVSDELLPAAGKKIK